jgi:hypothetical protein
MKLASILRNLTKTAKQLEQFAEAKDKEAQAKREKASVMMQDALTAGSEASGARTVRGNIQKLIGEDQ